MTPYYQKIRSLDMMNKNPFVRKLGFIALLLVAGMASRAPLHAQPSCAAPPAGMIAWWPGDGNTSDIIGTNDGTLENGATFAAGFVDQTFSLDGTDDFVSVPDDPMWTFTDSFTVDLWANFDSVKTGTRGLLRNVYVGHDDAQGTFNKWVFHYAENGLFFHINGPVVGSVFIGPAVFAPTKGTWHHFAVTRDDTTYTFYADGVPIDTLTDSRAIPDADASLTIGQAEGLGFFEGSLEEIEIFDRALNASEIEAIFNAGSEGKCKPSLPVELVSFDAVQEERSVYLRWITAGETNNAGFEIERARFRKDATPKMIWERIGFVQGEGTTDDPHEYRFTVNKLDPGLHRFRLKQIDFDGAFEYSPIVEAFVAVPDRFLIEPAYPNPFNPTTTLRFAVAATQQVEVTLVNSMGQSIRTLYSGMVPANQMQELSVGAEALPSGTYIVHFEGNGFSATEPIVLAK